ncbi:unnamed protein product [Prunus brigantina]
MRNIWDVPLKPPADKLGNHDLLREVVSPLSRGKEMLIFLYEVRVAYTSQGMEIELGVTFSNVGVFDLRKTNFLSSPSTCVKLVDHIHQVFAIETIRNSSDVAPSSAQVSELEKKNAELTSKLSAEQIRYEKKMSKLRAMISELKSSLAEKDCELSSSAANLVS